MVSVEKDEIPSETLPDASCPRRAFPGCHSEVTNIGISSADGGDLASRTAVDHDEFEVRICLVHHTLDGGRQIRRRVMARDDHRHEGDSGRHDDITPAPAAPDGGKNLPRL